MKRKFLFEIVLIEKKEGTIYEEFQRTISFQNCRGSTFNMVVGLSTESKDLGIITDGC